jgi:hypothetical protein
VSGVRTFEAVRGACLALVVAFGVGACTDLGAIRQFADTAADGAGLRGLADEYAAAPERRQRYAPERQRAAGPTAPDPERMAQRDRMLVLQRAIEDYMTALGELAADEAVSYDPQVDALGQALTRTGALTAQELDAGQRLARLLLRAASDRWRRERIDALIGEGHEPLIATIGALRQIAEEGFLGEIEIEAVAMRSYYERLRRESQDPAGIAAAGEWQEFRRAELERRRLSIEAYVEVLDGIRAGHEALHAGRGDLSRETLLVEVRRYANDIRRAAAAVRRIV